MDSILTSKLLMQPAFCISQHQRKGRQVLFRNDRVSLQKHLLFVIHNILHRNIFFCDINLLGRFLLLYKNRKSLRCSYHQRPVQTLYCQPSLGRIYTLQKRPLKSALSIIFLSFYSFFEKNFLNTFHGRKNTIYD